MYLPSFNNLLHLYNIGFAGKKVLLALTKKKLKIKSHSQIKPFFDDGHCQNYLQLTHPRVLFSYCIQLFRERLSEKAHVTIPKCIVGSYKFTVPWPQHFRKI